MYIYPTYYNQHNNQYGLNYCHAVSVINVDFVISVVLEIEVLSHHEIPEKMPLVEAFLNMATVLPLDNKIVKKAIELRRNQRRPKLADAIIAATAIVFQLTLITNNIKDFKDIADLIIINLHAL